MIQLRVQPVEDVGLRPHPELEGRAPWDSVKNIEDLINRAVPDFHCPACRGQRFELLNDFESHAMAQLNVYVGAGPDRAAFIPTLAMICEDCGFVAQFANEALQKKAERV